MLIYFYVLFLFKVNGSQRKIKVLQTIWDQTGYLGTNVVNKYLQRNKESAERNVHTLLGNTGNKKTNCIEAEKATLRINM